MLKIKTLWTKLGHILHCLIADEQSFHIRWNGSRRSWKHNRSFSRKNRQMHICVASWSAQTTSTLGLGNDDTWAHHSSEGGRVGTRQRRHRPFVVPHLESMPEGLQSPHHIERSEPWHHLALLLQALPLVLDGPIGLPGEVDRLGLPFGFVALGAPGALGDQAVVGVAQHLWCGIVGGRDRQKRQAQIDPPDTPSIDNTRISQQIHPQLTTPTCAINAPLNDIPG